MPRTGFDPRAHGFHFANDFVDKVVTVPGFGEVATDGRAGGMTFAALDYWFAGLPVPSHRPEDFPDRAVPEDGSRLADFIHKRLFDSYATWSARQFLTWTLAEDHPTWSSPGVAAMTAEELPRVRRSLEAGRPVVLGLVAGRSLDEVARNRQVVAYGYDEDGAGPGGGRSGCSSTTATTPTPRSCSPPSRAGPGRRAAAAAPGGGCSSRTTPASGRPTSTSARPRASGSTPGPRPWAGTSWPSSPPATTASTGPTWPSCGWPCAARPARTLTASWAATATPARSSRARSGPCSRPATASAPCPGSYAIAAGYLSEQGSWLPIPPGEPGAVEEVGVTVIPPPRRARVTVSFRAVTVEDADALGGLLTLRLAIGDQAVRWPEEGMADVQDGKRFALDQRFDLVLNPSSVLSVSVTGSDASGAPPGWCASPTWAWTTGARASTATAAAPSRQAPERPGPDAGDGPWTIEYAVEVTPLEA